ncbi:DUF927 domain-containing protein [Enterococcus durans]|uniref:DUF927 domain-containing protein n=1 Tax=Enterococcus durans TaxID=53345 RepID=UPI003567A7F1
MRRIQTSSRGTPQTYSSIKEALINGKGFLYDCYYLSKEGVKVEDRVIAKQPIWIDQELCDLETGLIKVEVKFCRRERYHSITLPYEEIMNHSPKKLMAMGLPILPKYWSDLQDYLARQIEESSLGIISKTIGWQRVGEKWHYLLQSERQLYCIENPLFHLKQKGSYEAWYADYCQYIRGNLDLELLVLFGLCPVVIGYTPVAEQLDLEPFVLHLYGDSSSGKTTTLMLLISMYSSPTITEPKGLFHSHSSTINALTKLGNLQGVLVGLDDSAASQNLDYTNFIYRIANSVDKFRLNSASELQETDTFKVVIFSTGEAPLGKGNQSGSFVRLLQLTDLTLTQSVTHSQAIKRMASTNYGFLAKKLAQHLQQMDISQIVERIQFYSQYLLKEVPIENSKVQRIILRFSVVLFIGEILNELDFNISIDQITLKLTELLKREALKLDILMVAYPLIRGYIESIQTQFKINGCLRNGHQVVLGKIDKMENKYYRVRMTEQQFKTMLTSLNLPSERSILKEMKKRGLLVGCEKDRLYLRSNGGKYASFRIKLDL